MISSEEQFIKEQIELVKKQPPSLAKRIILAYLEGVLTGFVDISSNDHKEIS